MPTNVAIACQGGGSHTAFTGGVLKGLLPHLEAVDCQLVGLSGTSGGAVSAVAGWYGYLDDGGRGAVETIDGVWADVAADDPLSRWTNQLVVWHTRLQQSSLPTPQLSPYHLPFADLGKRAFLDVLEDHVDFERIPDLVASADCPRLVVGTVDVNAGEFETFTDAAVTPAALMASAAVPTMFRAVEIDDHYHWDGLFSQNPPIYDLLHVDPARKPDELWVVQINPQTRAGEPTTMPEIIDRRNELSGNISLNQELRFVERVNEWVDRGHLPADRYAHTEIRRIGLDQHLSYASKLDRSAAFVEELLADGERAAEQFLAEIDVGSHEHDVQGDGAH
jgi:NTE family protein